LRFVIGRSIVYLLAFTLGLLFLAPFLFAVSTSLKDVSEIYAFPPKWIPSRLVWRNYAEAWTMAPFTMFLTNTVVITAFAMLGQLVSTCLVAYGFARFQFPGRNQLFIVLLATMIIPIEVTIIPSFLLFKYLNWLDTWLPLIVPAYFGGSAFSIFLMRQFFLTLPRELDEAAEIEGAGALRILWSILLPLMRPAIASVSIFSFVGHWNSFFLPLVYLSRQRLFPMSLGLRYFQRLESQAIGGPPAEHYLMAVAIVMTIPIIILFFTLQRYFIQGIAMSGIKG
jgi:ABC-type glycerol-3-phosphate transport system permease component